MSPSGVEGPPLARVEAGVAIEEEEEATTVLTVVSVEASAPTLEKEGEGVEVSVPPAKDPIRLLPIIGETS